MEEFARSLLEQIDDPEHPVLRDQLSAAMQQSRQILDGTAIPEVTDGVVRRLSYTYYYDWETDDPDYMLLVQDPGNLHTRHLDELRGTNPLADGCSYRDQIHTYRQFGKSWLSGRNKDFSKQFFGALASHGVIDLEADWQRYLASDQLYRDFYLGDVMKYRADGFGRRAEDISYTQYLEAEIQALQPDLIFTFGGNAWSTVRGQGTVAPVANAAANPAKMMDIHGVLHELTEPVSTFVLPLSHMSSQVWWRFPPEEYIDRLNEGVSLWTEIA